jgi:NAD(P)H-hydrate epimerase
MRSGAGLVTLGVPQSLNNAIIKIKPKEVMTLPLAQTKDGVLGLLSYREIKDFARNIDILVIGPGLGKNEATQTLIRKVIANIEKPVVIDADGLNALAGHLDILRKPRTENREPILTPHPKEMSRLLGISVDKVQANRESIAFDFAEKHKVTVVLKGHNTVVSDCKNNLYINKTGNPGMSTAGSGDVLTGMIAALLGQGLTAFESAKYGVYLHGLAGDLAAKEKTQICLIASDIIGKIPNAVKRSF